MVWELSDSSWVVIAAVSAGVGAVAIARPWRFFQGRTRCPQCRNVLPRWDCWGWRQVWVCCRCGCQVGR